MSKRGISALISVVLLVGFAIALAAVVSTFIIDTAKDFDAEKLAGVSQQYCQDVYLVQTTQPITTPTNCGIFEGTNFTNKGKFTITKLSINPTDLDSYSQDISLKPIENQEISFLGCSGKDVKMIPWITIDNQEIICSGKQIKINT